MHENIQKQLLDTGLDASKKVLHKAGKILGNKITDAVLLRNLTRQTKSNDENMEKQKPLEEIIFTPKKE